MNHHATVPVEHLHELRCTCHRLLARVRNGKVVLRCPRCKTEAVLKVAGASLGVDYHLVFEKRK